MYIRIVNRDNKRIQQTNKTKQSTYSWQWVFNDKYI